ncbi:hypothetical protein B0H63DRAFT_503454 [Podospora didyma]|uniref:Uncharacterized protein n=1 Tax=Podospora didyma TaxID=330526 RepID=A0AAE0K8J4_9PEZI|nr:hypothetical protein B0H63DRAFT_503454 [Podospora didyma]
MSSIKDLWWAKHRPPSDPTHLSFKNKAVLVMGANSGLGYEAAVKHAEKGEHAKSEMIRRAGCQPDAILILTLNAAAPGGLHVAQLAAGVATLGFEQSSEGDKSALQVNVLSTALLTLLLLPKMREIAVASAPDSSFVPHMSFVHSIASMEYFALRRTVEEGSRTLISDTSSGRESYGKLSELLESERGTELFRQTWEEILRKHVPDSALL